MEHRSAVEVPNVPKWESTTSSRLWALSLLMSMLFPPAVNAQTADKAQVALHKIAELVEELRSAKTAPEKLIPVLLNKLAECPQDTQERVAVLFQNEFHGDSAIIKSLISYMQSTPANRLIPANMLLAMSFQGDFSVDGEEKGYLVALLKNDQNPRMRSAMVQLLPRIGTNSKWQPGSIGEIKATLIQRLVADPVPDVRLLAAMSLGEIGRQEFIGDNETTINALTRCLSEDSNERVRGYAAYALGCIGEKASAATGVLCQALTDHSPEVRGAAIQAIEQIGPSAAQSVPILVKIVRGPNESLPRGSARQMAASALGHMGEKGAAAVPALNDLLTEQFIRVTAANALKRIGPAAAPAVPNLITMLDSADWIDREAAASCLAQLGSAAKSALPKLKTCTMDERTRDGKGSASRACQSARDAVTAIESACKTQQLR